MKVVDAFPRKVRVIENCWIPLADGGRLGARIWLPHDAERDPVPAVLEAIPYRKRDFTRGRDEPMHHYVAGHGYAAVRVDLRGSGDSDGLLLDEYVQQEHDDALEVIEWLASRPWCTGAVGMMGISWGGFNALQVASRGPKALKAVISLCASDDRYADDAHFMGGCVLNENLTWGSVLMAFAALAPDPEVVGPRWRDMWLERLEHVVPFPAAWLEHQRRDAYWKHGSVNEDYGRITCPVYAIGGWADAYSNAVPRLLAGLRVPRKGLIGPWAHVFPHEGLPGPAIGFLQEAVRWWDHWLKGADTGIMDEPMYRVWMQEWVAPQPSYEERPGRWVTERSWPSSRIRPMRLALGPGRLGGEALPAQQIDFQSPQTAGLAAGDWCAFGTEGEMPAGQREDDGKSVCFDSEPLDDRLEILGAAVVTLDLAVDRPCALVCVRLCDVAPDGASLRVSYGLLNLAHRDGHERPEPLVPGRRYRVAVTLNDAAHAFPPGHSVRLAISTSYWPIAWPSPRPATLSLFTGDAVLELPVRPPGEGDEPPAPFQPPEQARPMQTSLLHPARFKRTIERDLATNETVYTILSEGADLEGAFLQRVETINLDVGYSILRCYRIREDDPLSASAEVRQRAVLRREDWSIRVETRCRMTASASSFHVDAELEAFEGRDLAFCRSWNRRITRDLV